MSLSPPKTKYRCPSIQRYIVGSDEELIYVTLTGNTHLLPTTVANIVDHCRSFLDLDRHAQRLSEKFHYGHEQHSIKQLLARLVENRLLVSDTSAISSYGGLSGQSKAKITSLGIITSGRPQCLRRCLGSYASNIQHHGHEVALHVVDDSLEPSICKQNLAHAAEVQQQFDISVSYIGREQKSQLAQYLIGEGIDPDPIHFAIFNTLGAAFPTGANRNSFLLSTIGEIVLSVDDDTVCSISPSVGSQSVLALTSRSNPRTLSFYSSREKLLEATRFVETDFIHTHIGALGRPLREFIPQFVGFSDVDEADMGHDFMRAVETGNGQILLTQYGLVGDCGFHSPLGYLSAKGSTRAKLLESEATYDAAFTSREVANIVNDYTLTDSPHLMSYAFGMDNRCGVVPFFPVQRNDEGIFSMVLRRCFSESLTCHLPYAIAHYPPEKRCFDEKAIWRDLGRLRMTDIVLLCLSSYRFDAATRDPNLRLRKLGGYLLELASMTNREFCEFVRHVGRLVLGRKLSEAQRFYGTQTTAPTFWAKDMRRYLEVRKQALVQDNFPIPSDLPHSKLYSEPSQFAQELVRQYGTLLKIWPDIVTAARNLRQREQWPAVSVASKQRKRAQSR